MHTVAQYLYGLEGALRLGGDTTYDQAYKTIHQLCGALTDKPDCSMQCRCKFLIFLFQVFWYVEYINTISFIQQCSNV